MHAAPPYQPVPPIRADHWAWRLLVLAIGCLVLYLAGNQGYDLLTDDEARYAESGRRMVASGDWIIPEFNGYPRYHKPILFYWLQALAQALFGSTLWAARLPTALAGTGAVLMTACLGKAFWGPRVGFWSGVALATSLEMVLLSRMVMTDVVLLLFIQGALTCFHLSRLGNKQTLWQLLGCACVGLGFLTKGPIAIFLPLAIVLPWLAMRGELRHVLRTFPWLLGTLIVLALALPWYACAHWRTDGAFTRQFFLAENLGRYVANVNKHELPFFVYLLLLVPMTFPWAAVLPQSIWAALKHVPWRGPYRESVAWLLAWQVVIVFVLFTFSSTRVWTYTLTAFPPLALFVGKWLADVTTAGSAERRALLGPLFLFALLATHAAIASLLVPLDALPRDVRSEELLWAVRAGLASLTLLAWLLVLLAKWATPRTTTYSLVAGVGFFYLGAGTWLMPAFDREFKQPVRAVAGVVRGYPAARVITYFVHEHGLNFHGQVRHVGHWREGSLDDLHALLASSEQVFLLMAPERIAEFENTTFHVWLSHRRFVLGANFPPPDTPMICPDGELAHLGTRQNP